MTDFNPMFRYMGYACDFENDIMAYEPTNAEEYENAMDELLEWWSDDDAQKVLSELSLDYYAPNPIEAVKNHYVQPHVMAHMMEIYTN